jgi:hypothetical protein
VVRIGLPFLASLPYHRVRGLVSAVILTLAGAGITAGDIEVESATLEDAFLQLTGRRLHDEGTVTRL